MSERQDSEKKIIVDEGWKEEAQREKEILAAKEQQEKNEETDQAGQPRGPLPRGDLAALISMLTTQALFALGWRRGKAFQGGAWDRVKA